MDTRAVTEELTTDQIKARLEAAKNNGGVVPEAPPADTTPKYRYYKPLEDAASEYVKWARNPQDRIYTGISEFDEAMRGIAPGELCLVNGFAHSGKTVFTTEVIRHNPDKRIILFTPDETRVMVLIKLAAITHGMSARDLEEKIALENGEAEAMIRDVAREHYPNLVVFEETMDIQMMDNAVNEVEEMWGAPAQLICFDYVDLLAGIDDTVLRMTTLKAWGKRRKVPFILLHQSSRSAGKDGAKQTITSGGYGGEQQATFVVGVRRKKSQIMAMIEELNEKIAKKTGDTTYEEDKKTELEYELRRHENTVTFNLVKNKRPPGGLVDDVDYLIDKDTGRVQRDDGGLAVPGETLADRVEDTVQEEVPF